VTTRARQVLADCEVALVDFAASANTDFQRTRWVSLITLLRTVLDVLEQVDGPAGTAKFRTRLHDARKRLFEPASKHESSIYHDFIEDERNDVVHEYALGAAVNVRIQMPAGPSWAPVVSDYRGGNTTTTYEFFMRDGPFRGQDPRELCRRAIAFWNDYLAEIEQSDRE
jgi:hypothetical protein